MQNAQLGYVWGKENEMMNSYGGKMSRDRGDVMTKRSMIHSAHWRRDVKEFCFVFGLCVNKR